jgi:hypothetical protein
MRLNKSVLIILGVIVLLIVGASLDRESEWEGIDVSVVGKYATELGVEPSTPLIDVRGDALLFAFAAGGAIGGFVAGYYWRELFGSHGGSDRAVTRLNDNPTLRKQA